MDNNLPTYASDVTRIIGVNHHAWLIFEIGFELVSKLNPPISAS
jgi:hypothetical protein